MTFRTTLAAALSCALILPVMIVPAQAGFEWTPPLRALPKAAPQEAEEELPPVIAAPAMPVDSLPLEVIEEPVPVAPPVDYATEAATQIAISQGKAAPPPSDPWAQNAARNEAPILHEDPTGRVAAPDMMVPHAPPYEPVIPPRHMAIQAQPVPPMPSAPVDPDTIPPAVFMKAEPMPVPVMAPMSLPNTVGFGRDIPLALALQQIVPAGYSFAFADGANPGTRVSWDGGRPWNHVLTDAVAPFGMMSYVAGNTVWIRQAAPYMPAPVPVTAMSMAPVPPMPMATAIPVGVVPAMPPEAMPVGHVPAAPGCWDPSYDWRNEGGYEPSYPRRDPVAARDRLMNDAAMTFQYQEPSSGNNPDIIMQPAWPGDETMSMNAPAGAPMPLLAPEAPVAEAAPGGKAYMQLTGFDDSMMRNLDTQEIRYWQAQKGESLRTVLTNWSEQVGVQLFWAEGQDYEMPVPVQMHGTFQSAISKVLEDFGAATPQPQGQLHPNQPTGPAVLIIDHRA